MGHNGQAHSVIMAPGDMVLYESAKAIHARMIPLNGTSYDNVFVHFRPSKGWEKFVDVPNGGVVAGPRRSLIRPQSCVLACEYHRSVAPRPSTRRLLDGVAVPLPHKRSNIRRSRRMSSGPISLFGGSGFFDGQVVVHVVEVARDLLEALRRPDFIGLQFDVDGVREELEEFRA